MDGLMAFFCARCGVQVSRRVAHLNDLSLLSEDSGDYDEHGQMVPRGRFVMSEEAPHSGVPPGEVILHTEDVLRHPTKMNPRDVGCCGYGGSHGYNVYCRSGHAIGTEISDCCIVNYTHIPGERLTSGQAPDEEPDSPAGAQREVSNWVLVVIAIIIVFVIWLLYLGRK